MARQCLIPKECRLPIIGVNTKPCFKISEESIAGKCKAMESYEFEKRTYPHPRSSKALKIRAQMWGVANGIKLAEVFQVIRSIEKI